MFNHQLQSQQESKGTTTLTNEKKKYKSPELLCYGSVSALTQSGTMGSSENGSMISSQMATSDIRLKEDIVFVSKHPLGFALYLFDYKAEFSELYGRGRQFGVMAQEVETVMPDAVDTYTDGYKRVNYAMLGISLCSNIIH